MSHAGDLKPDYDDPKDDASAAALPRRCPPRADRRRRSARRYHLDDEDEPLSLAEEIAAEGGIHKDAIHDRYEEIKQIGRHPHRRVAADVDGRADRGGPQG